jgi:uncharacterized protein YjbI with pentapeptide repeats
MYQNILIIICSVSSILNIIYNQPPFIYNINITYINNICNDTHLNYTNINNSNLNYTNINNSNLNYTNINNSNLNYTNINNTNLNYTNINNTNLNYTNINNTNLNYTNINNTNICNDTNINNTNICNDTNIYCSNWSKYNECIANPIYMLNYCKKSCETCNISSSNIDKIIKIYSNMCIDLNNNCVNWTIQGECQKNPSYMLERCKKSCKVC